MFGQAELNAFLLVFKLSFSSSQQFPQSVNLQKLFFLKNKKKNKVALVEKSLEMPSTMQIR